MQNFDYCIDLDQSIGGSRNRSQRSTFQNFYRDINYEHNTILVKKNIPSSPQNILLLKPTFFSKKLLFPQDKPSREIDSFVTKFVFNKTTVFIGNKWFSF